MCVILFGNGCCKLSMGSYGQKARSEQFREKKCSFEAATSKRIDYPFGYTAFCSLNIHAVIQISFKSTYYAYQGPQG